MGLTNYLHKIHYCSNSIDQTIKVNNNSNKIKISSNNNTNSSNKPLHPITMKLKVNWIGTTYHQPVVTITQRSKKKWNVQLVEWSNTKLVQEIDMT
jgi:hypothetical protein